MSVDADGIDNAIQIMNHMIDRCDIVVSHSADWDKRMFGLIAGLNFQDKLWVCTLRDITWENYSGQSLALGNLCAYYKVSDEQAHTALGDCHRVLQCLWHLPDPGLALRRGVKSAIWRATSHNLIQDLRTGITPSDVEYATILANMKHALTEDSFSGKRPAAAET